MRKRLLTLLPKRVRAGFELVEHAPHYIRAGNASLDAVKALLKAWEDDGVISEKEQAEIQKALEEAEAVRYMEHFLRMLHRLTGNR